jgi:hypothetical protein
MGWLVAAIVCFVTGHWILGIIFLLIAIAS